jgi:hypothetical protein
VLLLLLLLWVATRRLCSLLQQPDSRTCSFSRSAAEYDMKAAAAQQACKTGMCSRATEAAAAAVMVVTDGK